MTRSCLSIVLAAGEGTRMKSERPKVLHEVAHLPMVGHVVDAAVQAGGDHIALVVGRGGEAVEKAARARFADLSVHPQHERLGTAHAVLAAADTIERGFDDVLVLFGDATLIGPDTLRAARRELAAGASVCVVGFRTTRPHGLGRLLMEGEELLAIREEKEANEEERRIELCNGGIMAIDGARALALLRGVRAENAKGEYYLTDIVELARAQGGSVRVVIADENELLGVNTRAELAIAEAIWQRRRRERLMLAGVTMVAPETVFLAHDTEIEPDTVIEPNVVFGPGVRVASGATIHAFCHLEGAVVAAGASIGPFARLRPGASIGDGAKVGNFCEVKNATVEADAKINHLSYVGDASVGAGANLGAGTITCNYDGFNKHHTAIGAGAFIGSNSSLVAPVTIGARAYIGSGSVITDAVPDGALAIGRGRQVTKEGRGIALAERLAAEKAAKTAKP